MQPIVKSKANIVQQDGAVDSADNDPAHADPGKLGMPVRGRRFRTIMTSVGLAGLLNALEATITSTASPSIVADLGGGDVYVWAVNGYFPAL